MKANQSTRCLWATKKGEPDYAEQLITEVAERIPAASEWAKANGFDRLRVSEFDGSAPDFSRTISA
jgi:hypothetical protein